MVAMPTIEVTKLQADRILAAFKAKYGTTTTAETVEAYKAELTKFIVSTVMNYEADIMVQQEIAERNVKLDAVLSQLPAVPAPTGSVGEERIGPPHPDLSA